MCMVQKEGRIGPAAFICAQSGCGACQERLVRHHEGLVHAVIRRSWVGSTEYEDLLQEGRIGLWRAICGFDVVRGRAFSTYAWTIIERQVWAAVKQEERQRRVPPLPWPQVPAPEGVALAAWQADVVRAALGQALAHLNPRSRELIVAAYGLAGQEPSSLAAIGRHHGVSREAVRQWRNDALVLLRLPAVCGQLARLCDQHDRQGHRRRQQLSQAWLKRRRGRQP